MSNSRTFGCLALVLVGVFVLSVDNVFGQDLQDCFSAPAVRNETASSPCTIAEISKELSNSQIAETLYPASRIPPEEIAAFGIEICSNDDLASSISHSIVQPSKVYSRIKFVYGSKPPPIFIRAANCNGRSTGPKYPLRVVVFPDVSSIGLWKDRVMAKDIFSDAACDSQDTENSTRKQK
ncbi:MAG: hypothetical protein UZ17_ACD001002409 [Acidobacteria bacterium OLB17]|nr:MAG: hypothetical protein UZ17_ACD001002409 [Acidobacteria bacterium OLB17]